MSFDSVTGHLACPSCGREDNIDTFDDDYIEQAFEAEDAVEYHCQSCGANVLTDPETTATTCSFCGSNVVIGDRLVGKLAPKKVIPFTINKDEAMQTFKKWCKNGRFTPKGFMTANRVKNITGIYIPFWIYDLNSRAKIDAVGTKVRTYTRGDYIYTETKFFDIHRDIELAYHQVPVDASIKMDDKLMDTLEPYHYEDLKKFKTPYLAGYLAEKYDLDAKALFPRIKSKIAPYVNTYMRGTMAQYNTITNKSEDVDMLKQKSEYVLFPIWMVYYDYDNQEHTFAMNGQTGKVVGKPPISQKKIWLWRLGIASGSFVAIKIISFLVSGVLW